MRVRFWNRGRSPPGPGTNYFGGKFCVELTTANGDLLIFDCGTARSTIRCRSPRDCAAFNFNDSHYGARWSVQAVRIKDIAFEEMPRAEGILRAGNCISVSIRIRRSVQEICHVV
jgi:hypothetical protein